MLRVCCCYAHEDEEFLRKLEKHLTPLRKGVDILNLWSTCEIETERDGKPEIERHLRDANIILLLVSPDLIASDLCYSLKMQQAIERQREGEAVIIPIILRAVLWQVTPLGKLQALPRNNRPIALWRDRDAAFLSVVSEIWTTMKNLIEEKYKKLGATDKDLSEARAGFIRTDFEFEQFFLFKDHTVIPGNRLKEEDRKIYNSYIRSLEIKRKRLRNKVRWTFAKRKFFNVVKYTFKSTYKDEKEAFFENEEFFRACNQMLCLKRSF